MSLVIHDLTPEEWRERGAAYEGWDVVADTGAIRPCVGCFACWDKTPGECVLRDGFGDMGARIHRADEVHVISRYTCGGFSGFVKNVFDRSLGYVLPQFEVVNGETHHLRRYDEDKPFTFIFRGAALTEDEKASARRYVTAVCANIRGHVKDVLFREDGAPAAPARRAAGEGRLLLLNGSMRCASGNSAKLARELARRLRRTPEAVNLRDYLSDLTALVRELETADTLVLCAPLYVDGMPSQVVRLMERVQAEYQGGRLRVYVLANMGLYESRQLVNLFDAARQWCHAVGFDCCGGLGVSAGELLGVLMEHIPFRLGATRDAARGMDALANAIDTGAALGDLYAEPRGFPRALFTLVANVSWNRSARKNGLAPKELYRRL